MENPAEVMPFGRQTPAKTMTRAYVLSQKALTDDMYSLWLAAPAVAKEARPGQFILVYTDDPSRLLPRPISLCETDAEKGYLRLVYRVAGGGTLLFSKLKKGDTLRIMGPLGNGYPGYNPSSAFIIGGGAGIPPLLALAKTLPGEKQIVLGYKSKLFLNTDFEPFGKVTIATEDGSCGIRGNVLDAIKENHLKAGVIYACGPLPMLRSLKAYAAETGIECYISLEERMACGIGACLSCVCKTVGVDEHTNVCNRRICCDGPVFRAGEVKL